jgi:hypothetical protein
VRSTLSAASFRKTFCLKWNVRCARNLEREKGIEPSPQAWEARVLPLNYSRSGWNNVRVALDLRCAQYGFGELGERERLTIQDGRKASVEGDSGEIGAFREFEFHPSRDAI